MIQNYAYSKIVVKIIYFTHTVNKSLMNMENKFLPLSVETIESHLNVVFVENSEFSEDLIRPLRKNIAYNIQYIQYLNKVIMEEEFTSVLLKMNIKSFIIHCSSIVEGLLYFLVVSHGYAEKKYWVQVSSVKTNEYQIDTSSYFQEINIFKKTSNQQKPNLTFDQLQKKAEKKKILGDDHNLYALISKIRKVRNKIHIHETTNRYDTDYNSFNMNICNDAKDLLFRILTCHIFESSNYNKCFQFLNRS